MIKRTTVLEVKNYKISLSSPLKFYRGDSLHLDFVINQWDITLQNNKGAMEPIYPSRAFLFIETPDATDYVESAKIDGSKITYHIDGKYTGNIGFTRVQIVLLDELCCRKALPPFEIEITDNIFDREWEPPRYKSRGLYSEDGVALISEEGKYLNDASMVGVKISELPVSEELEGDLPIIVDGVTKRVSLELVCSYLEEVHNADIKMIVEELEKVSESVNNIDLSMYATREEVDKDILKSVTMDNGSSIISPLGGIKTGDILKGMTVKQVLDKLLYPHVPPILYSSLEYSPSGSVFEYGDTISLTRMFGRVISKSHPVVKMEFLEGTRVLREITTGIVDNTSYQHQFLPTVNITSNLSSNRYRLRVTDSTGAVQYMNTSSISFYYPFYYGVIESGVTITTDVVNSLTKVIEPKGNKTLSFTTDDQRMVIAYLSSYGPLTRILDPNNFDVTPSFTRYSVGVRAKDGTLQSYYVYANNNSTVTSFKLIFQF